MASPPIIVEYQSGRLRLRVIEVAGKHDLQIRVSKTGSAPSMQRVTSALRSLRRGASRRSKAATVARRVGVEALVRVRDMCERR